ncbi:putative Plant invertase/pectin methylesterase inhibitor superfamily protein [Tripterygium wilfordii]|uniref:Putative Plant invertase/pectin methylesterase inhibitor superfamily protein n=1 Tax=Tripterygium wilfordii TaxID=458696 RepID=A0A7J7CLE3_TRIWF|nr:21 kDa protein-like [Tripterygium wilfordii]KAF5734880.1 putative Plant invertase/pectin methylesterase inhibitor superfamily protein [Tripterygium wilfordii]
MEGTFAVSAITTLFFLIQLLCFTSGFPAYDDQDTEYIKTSCTNTTYPRLCYRSLAIYASKIKSDPKLLAKTALNVTFVSTRSTARLMKRISRIHNLRPRVAGAVADCVELVGDSVDELQGSIGEMDHARGGPNFGLVMNDIQTWVSAALTDDDTCMDGFDGKAMNGRVKILVRKHILRVCRLTSNALALVNNYASSQTGAPLP